MLLDPAHGTTVPLDGAGRGNGRPAHAIVSSETSGLMDAAEQEVSAT